MEEDVRWKQRFQNYKKAYDDKTANDLFDAIIKIYYHQFIVLAEKMAGLE